jgi:phospholipase/carboxylesterase
MHAPAALHLRVALKRRFAALLAVVIGVHGCTPGGGQRDPERDGGLARPPETAGNATAAAKTAPSDELRYLTRLTAGASGGERLPMIIALHGYGDTPENFSRIFDGAMTPARVILPFGKPHGSGYSWFDARDAAGSTAGVRDASARVAAAIPKLLERFPTRGKPIVTGFSQGGVMSFAIAALHPDSISAALPIAGFLPSDITPSAARPGSAPPPVIAFHGTDDTRVPFARGSASVDALKSHGFEATLTPFPGLGHAVTPEELQMLFGEIGRQAARFSASP